MVVPNYKNIPYMDPDAAKLLVGKRITVAQLVNMSEMEIHDGGFTTEQQQSRLGGQIIERNPIGHN